MNNGWMGIITLLFFAIAIPATAQNTDTNQVQSISIDVSAEILDEIELVTLRNISFRNAQPSEGEVSINPVTDGGAGKMRATGRPGGNVRVTFIEERELVNILNASNTLTFFYQVAVNSEDEQSSSELVETNSREFRFNEDGELYIWIGGRVNILNAQPGGYRGEFTLEVEYI